MIYNGLYQLKDLELIRS